MIVLPLITAWGYGEANLLLSDHFPLQRYPCFNHNSLSRWLLWLQSRHRREIVVDTKFHCLSLDYREQWDDTCVVSEPENLILTIPSSTSANVYKTVL